MDIEKVNELISKHIQFDIDSLQMASVKNYVSTGRINGSLLVGIKEFAKELIETLPCNHPFEFVVQNNGDCVCFKCGHKIK